MNANELRRGTCLLYNGHPYRVLEFEHRQPGKGGAFVQAKLRNLLDGTQRDVKFRSTETVEEAFVVSKEMDFLYHDGSGAVFMDIESFEQITLPDEFLGDARPWLTENMRCWVDLHDEKPISLTLPKVVEVVVRDADAVVKGQTAAKSNKPATLENGVTIQVPPFIERGDKLRVDPSEGRYIERAK